MKREIKFRAKNLIKGDEKWVYGHYSEGAPHFHYITNNNGSVWPINPETVGEFTGLRDCNNVEVYEEDILKTDVRAGNMKVIYFDTYASFMLEYKGLLYPLNEGADIEVIGNIWQNPELINK